MPSNLPKFVTAIEHTPDDIDERRRLVYDNVLAESTAMDGGNFSRFHPDDLKQLFEQYNEHFYERHLSDALDGCPLDFRISKRMTKAGGKTMFRRPRRGFAAKPEYEISVSAPLLFQTFNDVDRPIEVNGILATDRLHALQLVFEHELTHLVEFLVWRRSNCGKANFQTIAGRMFGHTKHTHQLITQGERAFHKFQLRVGDQVAFEFEGQRYEGIINRITKRATVLVEDERGPRYSDGKHYTKFYIPLSMLESVE